MSPLSRFDIKIKIFVSLPTCHDNMKMAWMKMMNNGQNQVDSDPQSDNDLLNDNDHHSDRMGSTYKRRNKKFHHNLSTFFKQIIFVNHFHYYL